MGTSVLEETVGQIGGTDWLKHLEKKALIPFALSRSDLQR